MKVIMNNGKNQKKNLTRVNKLMKKLNKQNLSTKNKNKINKLIKAQVKQKLKMNFNPFKIMKNIRHQLQSVTIRMISGVRSK